MFMEEIAGNSIATLTLPRFWIENPPLWFALVEAKLALSQISAPVTKYFYLLEALPQHVATEVRHYHYAGHNNILQRTQVGINCTACPTRGHMSPKIPSSRGYRWPNSLTVLTLPTTTSRLQSGQYGQGSSEGSFHPAPSLQRPLRDCCLA